MTLDQFTVFLGWCTVLNIGLLIISSGFLILGGSIIRPIHSRVLGLGDAELNKLYVSFLAFYKILIFVFNLIPYLALRIAF